MEDSQRSAVETRAKLAETTKRLHDFETAFGDDALRRLPPELQTLSKQLRAKEEEIQRLRLQDQQREQVCPYRRRSYAFVLNIWR